MNARRFAGLSRHEKEWPVTWILVSIIHYYAVSHDTASKQHAILGTAYQRHFTQLIITNHTQSHFQHNIS